MGSPITFSGFNQVDFNVVLTAVMRQESRPLQAMQQRRTQLQGVRTTYDTLSGKLGTLRSAATALASASTVVTNAATSTAPQSVGVSATSSAATGRYEVVVTSLARAQVMVSSTSAPDADTTVVASGGSLTIGGVAVTVAGSSTLNDVAAAINATDGIGVRAAVSETSPGAFHLVLTARESGASHAFTVENGAGGTLAFTDTDSDGVSGDSAADNAVQASNAALRVNNVAIEAASNAVTTAISGVTLTLAKEDPGTTIVIDVTRDNAAFENRVQSFVSAFNDLSAFADAQLKSGGPFGRDALMRSVRNELRRSLADYHGAGDYTHLAEVGLGFTRTGQLSLDTDALTTALQSNPEAVASLFASGTTGAFDAVNDVVLRYIDAEGALPSARHRLDDELSRLSDRITDTEARLELRRRQLQREYAAADALMSRLNSQSGSLSALANSLRQTRL